ncbi:MucB/RseB C-terminal domain-containing protein [Undibacterium parvum]|uniref:Transcriptional regulator n=1 Tax=Undibacterium parvum TaxID=401471 RepID=A0A3S9HNQ2_9BURK|nr:MucB/RseB C-terminal domain-containing protein [Undibacterium parvum]AZP13717.1 transcriptional regulator [Undibacterium parvum]
MALPSFKSRWCLLALIAMLSAMPALQAQAADTQEIQATLRKAQTAAQKLNYSGTFIYQQANQIRTSRIFHIVDAHGELEKLEILDGKPREYLRRNDEVSCYLPESKTVQVEKNVTQEVFPALLTNNLSSLPDFYNIKKSEVSRVAGLACQTLSLEPKDALRYGYRLCIEAASGLLLRAQTVNAKQEVIEQIAFTQVAIGEVDKTHLKPSFPNTAQWQLENLTVQANINSGWTVKSLPAGFKKTREMRRLIPLSAAAIAANAGSTKADATKSHQVVQMIFSDGISSISVFIEPDTGSRTEGNLQQGAMTIMGKRQADHWLTVVGEVPLAAIKQVINSIEFKSK